MRDRLRDPATAFGPIREVLARADVAAVNLETAIATGGDPQPKQYHFRASPVALDALAGAGVDVATMANNHAVDFGEPGLRQTLAALNARAVTSRTGVATARAGTDLAVVGVGADARSAYAPIVVEAAGRRVAFLGASAVPDHTLARWTATGSRGGIASVRERERILGSVREARRRADVVVVYLHWGVEYETCPDADQRSLARSLARAGADVVVGTHAHVQQGAGHIDVGDRTAYVAYGLGNFVFYAPPHLPRAVSGVLTLTLEGRETVAAEWTPARIDARGVPVPLTGAAAGEAVEDWRGLRRCAQLQR